MDHFRPEFLNRVDETIIFESLTKKQIADIVDLQFQRVADRLMEQRKIELKLEDSAKKLLAEKGFDPKFGARPLKRVIQRDILDELALRIIKGEIEEGNSVIVASEKKKIVFK